MMRPPFYVITGASGAGKSTLIAEFDELGYSTVPEAALAVMREQLAGNSKILPSGDRTLFMQEVLARSIQDYDKARCLKAPVFFDRGIPEWLRFLDSSEDKDNAISQRYRYAKTVFVAEPWPEIYVSDHARVHSFEKAARSYGPTILPYVEMGYEICLIPKLSVKERAAFILSRVASGV